MTNGQALIITGIGAVVVGCITMAFAFSRHNFISFFVHNEEDLKEVESKIPRGREFSRSMRTMAIIQIAIGLVLMITGLIHEKY